MLKINGSLCHVKVRTIKVEETMLLEDKSRESNFEELRKRELCLPDQKMGQSQDPCVVPIAKVGF